MSSHLHEASNTKHSEYAIQAKGLTKMFGQFVAVNDLNLAIPTGSIYGFLGPNGCGKSTSIRLLTGLLKPSSGEVSILGETLSGNEESIKRRVGYMTQKFSLYDNLSVIENLKFVSTIYGLKRSLRAQRIEELLNLYGLNDRAKQLAGSMSGGQKQRLALACATLHSPELLFLDEPTSAVDPENRREFWERLFDLCSAGTTILVSTHYMDEAERCHSLAIMENGHKRADGSPQFLMQNMPVNVVEVSGDNLRPLKHSLESEKDIMSAAQIGSRLRVLVDKRQPQPIEWVQSLCFGHAVNIARPNLEDVFVSCTGGNYVA